MAKADVGEPAVLYGDQGLDPARKEIEREREREREREEEEEEEEEE